MPSRSELDRVWADAYKKALSRGASINKAREAADYATAAARHHGGEGPLRAPKANARVDKILKERAKRANAEQNKIANGPEESQAELRNRLLERNKAFSKRWASRLNNVSPLNRLKLEKDMLKTLNETTEKRLKSFQERPMVPFERYLSSQETTKKVTEAIAKRLAGPTQWKNWTQAQRDEAIMQASYWEQRVREQEWQREPDYIMREYTAEQEAARRMSEHSLHRKISQMTRWSANEAGELGSGEITPVERTPYMSAKEMDRAIFNESVKWTGAKIGAAGAATSAAVKSGAKKVAGFGGRALARLGSGAVAGPAGMIAMGALTGWDVGNMIYDTAKQGREKMGSAQWPLAQAGVASLAALGEMLAGSGIAKPYYQEEPEEEIAGPIAPSENFLDEMGARASGWNEDAPVGFGPISDWNDMVDTVLGNVTGQGIEGEPDSATANEIVETWAKAYETEIKKGAKEDTSVASASPGDWFGGSGWDWANQMAQDKPAEKIAEAFDPWEEFNPRDQSSLEAHGADIGRGLGGSADEELKELMAQTSFLQKIADNTKEDEIAVLGV